MPAELEFAIITSPCQGRFVHDERRNDRPSGEEDSKLLRRDPADHLGPFVRLVFFGGYGQKSRVGSLSLDSAARFFTGVRERSAQGGLIHRTVLAICGQRGAIYVLGSHLELG